MNCIEKITAAQAGLENTDAWEEQVKKTKAMLDEAKGKEIKA